MDASVRKSGDAEPVFVQEMIRTWCLNCSDFLNEHHKTTDFTISKNMVGCSVHFKVRRRHGAQILKNFLRI